MIWVTFSKIELTIHQSKAQSQENTYLSLSISFDAPGKELLQSKSKKDTLMTSSKSPTFGQNFTAPISDLESALSIYPKCIVKFKVRLKVRLL